MRRTRESADAIARGRPLPREDRRVVFRLCLCALLVYLLFAHGNFSGSDEVGVFEATRSLWQRGELSVPESVHVFRGRDGRFYNHFAIGQSVLALPFYGLGALGEKTLPESWVRALAAWPGRKLESVSGRIEIFSVSLYSQVASSLLVGLFFAFQRRLGVSLRSALLTSALMGFTTYAATMSVYFLRHTTEALTILGGFYFFHLYRRSGRLAALVLGSALASLTILIRVPAAIAGLPLAGYLLWVLLERRRRDRALAALAAIAMPLAATLAIHVMSNQWKWGTWIHSPMLAQSVGFVTPLSVGLSGFLLSPGCSIFLYSPLLLLSPWTIRSFWSSHRAECAAVLGLALVFLVVCARFKLWTGLWSAPGPRYVFVLAPALMLALGPWLDAGGSARRRWAVGLGILGGLVQLALVMARWPAVIRNMRYRDYEEFSFVWVPELSPVLGSLETVARGQIDNWLLIFARGWSGREGHPLAALAVLGVWGLCLALALRGLRRSLRDHPERRRA